MESSNNIYLDRKNGKISNASTIESIGIRLMSLGAKLTGPIRSVGYSWIARAVKLVFPSQKLVVMQELEDTRFAYSYGDLYWSRLADIKSSYTPDMENFLISIKDVDYAFIDCGANYGFFSCMVTSEKYGKKPAIAIEADPKTFKFLENNCELNTKRFDIRHNAIFSQAGKTVNIYGEKHEARSIISDTNEDKVHGEVETITIDSFQDWISKKNKTVSVVKLDVEGVEIDALKGAKELLETDCLIYYEDHGSDSTHEISKYVTEELGLTIFSPDDSGKCRPINSLDELTAIKVYKRTGYDFIATKSEFWLDKISKLTV